MARPIRFLHLTTFYPPYSFGGDGSYVYRLAHELGDRGHLVDVVHCVDSYRLLAGREPSGEVPAHPNVIVHSLRSSLGWLSPVLSQQTGWPLLKGAAIQRVLDRPDRPVDVIHFHNVSLFGPGVLTMTNPRHASVTLYTTHEHWLVCPMHVLWKYNSRLCEKPTCFSCTLAAGRPPQLWRYTKLLSHAARQVDRFLSPSRFTARMHAERGFTQPVSHLPPFTMRCDTDRGEPAPRPHARPYFLYVGRLERVKGIDALCRAWAQISDIDLLVVGDGAERSRIDEVAAGNPHVVVRGAVPQEHLGPYYVHAIGVIVPSVVFEVAPTVVLEAFSRKTPVIARDLGGAAELVREGGGAECLYETDAGLRQIVGRLAADASLRQTLGDAGYRAFEQQWTQEAHLAAYLAVIDEVAYRKFGVIPWQSPS